MTSRVRSRRRELQGKNRSYSIQIRLSLDNLEVEFVPLRGRDHTAGVDLSLGPVIWCNKREFDELMRAEALDGDGFYEVLNRLENYLPHPWTSEGLAEREDLRNGKATGEEVPC